MTGVTKRRVVVEIELPAGIRLDEAMKNLKYKILYELGQKNRPLLRLIKIAKSVEPSGKEEPSILLEKRLRR